MNIYILHMNICSSSKGISKILPTGVTAQEEKSECNMPNDILPVCPFMFIIIN